ncbi:hypothetical protein A2W14_00730 [Candidatus Gottesmanbacteria bacterium RBG_16_37_8]|uniref:EamA domain-containing protein n=1 Tax=Candidatus Gottesmanbacteria bacterium RBG_16_37_8 TaxID=1798371 RepID=A0A1F5YVL5_9BACT|nr:MAG: hypothetical protein A2W14_00730 [Candidatus Gottesmanbacteria bacterium RBG_16_37_8]
MGLTVILYAFLHVIAKSEVGVFPSMYVTALRVAFAFLAFIPFLVINKPWRKKNFPQLLITSLFAAVNLIFFMYGIEYTTASVSQLVYAVLPILTIIVSIILFKEKFSPVRILGVIIGFIGIIYIFYLSLIEKGQTITGSFTGNMLISIAMVSWLTHILLSKKISRFFSPVEIGSITSLVTLILVIPLAFLQLKNRNYFLNLTPNLLLGTFYMGFFGTFLTWILIQYAVRKLSYLTVNLTSYIQPVATTIMAVIILKEKLSVNFITGSLLIFTGVFLTATWEIYRRTRS